MDTYAVPMPEQVKRLAAAYQDAQAAVKAATEQKDGLAQRLKLAAEEARAAAGYSADARVVYEAQDVAVYVTPVETWRVDSAKLKSEQPYVYAAYAKKSVSSRLEVKALG